MRIECDQKPRQVRWHRRLNALMTEQKRGLSLSDVLRQQDETHRRLIAYIKSAPEDQFMRDTRFRRRLRLDTYNH